ncbi:unnamed protein product, partial [Ectocarpus sp. 12 AP-2014]
GGPGSASGGGGRSSGGPNPDTLEALISVNHKLGLDMAAAGILRQAEQQAEAGLCEFVVRPSWLEKLWRWNDALKMYELAIEKCTSLLKAGVYPTPPQQQQQQQQLSPRAPLVITAGGGLSDFGIPYNIAGSGGGGGGGVARPMVMSRPAAGRQ